MKKLTIITALLLISITANQINCMDPWTDPYGLNDEVPATLLIKPESEKSVLVKKTYEQVLDE